MTVFSHAESDINTFRMITSQFCVNGCVKQSDIIRAFGVTPISVKRSVKTYREKGPKGFYTPRVTRGAAVLGRGATATMERLAASLGLLSEVTPRFAAALDIPKGGVLLALPRCW
jgi:hypothetical protein